MDYNDEIMADPNILTRIPTPAFGVQANYTGYDGQVYSGDIVLRFIPRDSLISGWGYNDLPDFVKEDIDTMIAFEVVATNLDGTKIVEDYNPIDSGWILFVSANEIGNFCLGDVSYLGYDAEVNFIAQDFSSEHLQLDFSLRFTGSMYGDNPENTISNYMSAYAAAQAYKELRENIDLFRLSNIESSSSRIYNNTNDTNIKLDSEIALTEGIRGAVVDVKNQPTDACIIRIYVGDQTKKREAAAREITRLLGEGYRPYQTFGISEDLARVLFVKYPEPNDANEPEILP